MNKCWQSNSKSTQKALTSSRQIGHLVSLSSFAHSLYVALGSEAMTSSGVALDRTSPIAFDNDNKASYDGSKSSSGYRKGHPE